MSVILISPGDLAALIAKAVEDGITRTKSQQAPAEFLSPSALAERLSVSRATIHRFLNGGMPSIGRGRSRRINAANAEQWLAEISAEAALDSDENDAATLAARKISRIK